MTSHATLSYKRSFQFTARYCSFDTTHSDCSHCITVQACARAPHTLPAIPDCSPLTLQFTLRAGLCSPIHLETQGRHSHQLHRSIHMLRTPSQAEGALPVTTDGSSSDRKLSQHQGCPIQTLTGTGIIQEQLIVSLSGSIHVITAAGIARSRLSTGGSLMSHR